MRTDGTLRSRLPRTTEWFVIASTVPDLTYLFTNQKEREWRRTTSRRTATSSDSRTQTSDGMDGRSQRI